MFEVLALLTVDAERQRHIVGIENFVGGHHPGSEHAIAIDRFAEAAIGLAAHRHVEAEAVAGDMVERTLAWNIGAGLADDQHELDLVVVAAIGETQRDALRRTDDRRIGLQKNSVLTDLRRMTPGN